MPKGALTTLRAQAQAVTVPPRRKALALAIAVVSDVVQFALLPMFTEGFASPFDVVLDVATALAILLVVGFHFRLVFALALELIPGVDLFPTWTAMVLTLPTEHAE